MTTRVLYHMVVADVLERVRRYSFFITLALGVYAAHAFLPPNHAAYSTLQMGGHRGEYNSAWVGSVVALLTAVFLSLVGFYLVKNAVDRDRATGVGEILAATKLSKPLYTLGKTLSNFLVLAAMTAVIALAAGAVQVVRAEDPQVQWGALIAPFAFLTLPVMMATAAVAVLFEVLPGLRGGFGNVAYFFLWTMALTASGTIGDPLERPSNDLMGRGLVIPSMVAECRQVYPDFDPDSSSFSMGLNFRSSGRWDLTTFRWPGVAWGADAIAGRGLWLLGALGLGVAAAIPFDRFDPSRAPRIHRRARRKRGSRDRATPSTTAGDEDRTSALPPVSWSTLAVTVERKRGRWFPRFAAMLAAELKLMLRGHSRWWFVVLGGLMVAALALPLDVARLRVLPMLWIWPVLLWSPLGSREVRHRTDAILFSAPHPIAIQLAASWAAGVALAVVTALPIGVRMALAGDANGLAAWGVGAAFIPALALVAGTWTGSSRTFEALYTIAWYIGPLQPVPALDFMGASREASESGVAAVYAGLAALFLALAAVRRWMQLRS